MPACHAGGHEFESRTHREKQPFMGCFFRFYICSFARLTYLYVGNSIKVLYNFILLLLKAILPINGYILWYISSHELI